LNYPTTVSIKARFVIEGRAFAFCSRYFCSNRDQAFERFSL